MLRSHHILLLLVALLATHGCSCEDSNDKAPSASAVLKPEVAAPAGLLAELALTEPEPLLADLREAAGGPALFLPRTVGGLLVNLFGLPLQASESFDARLPVVAASASAEGAAAGPVDWALAVHVRDPAALESWLTGGGEARFSASRQGDHVWLDPKPSLRGARLEASLGLLDHYFLAGNSRDALRRLGPYLTRTLARRAPASPRGAVIELREGALGGGLKQRLTDARGLMASFSLPKPWPTVLDLDGAWASAVELAGKLTSGRIVVTLDASGLQLDARLKVGDPGAGLATSKPLDVLQLPDDTLAALSWSQGTESRSAAAAQQTAALGGLLGSQWKEEDGRALADALGSLARGRGDRTTVAVRCTGVGITGMALGDVRDAASLGRGFEQLMVLRAHPVAAGELKKRGLELSHKKTRITEVPHDMWRLRLAPTKAKQAASGEEGAAAAQGPIDMLTMWTGERFVVTAGLETVDTMQRIQAPDPERNWARKAVLLEAVKRLPAEVWLAALVDPQGIHACMLGKPGGSFVAPFAFAVGPADGDEVAARLSIARPLLRFVAKELGGL